MEKPPRFSDLPADAQYAIEERLADVYSLLAAADTALLPDQYQVLLQNLVENLQGQQDELEF